MKDSNVEMFNNSKMKDKYKKLLKLKFISKGVLLSTYIVVTGFISDVISGNKVFPIISC